VETGLESVEPYRSVRTAGVVSSMPREIKGGHVIFRITGGEVPGGIEGEKIHGIDCAAYEPTKEFREVVRALRPGDSLEIYGGVRESPLTLNIEKMLVSELALIQRKKSNPVCGKCGKRMKSAGAGEGYRCRGCGTRTPESSAEYEFLERDITPGWYETPSCARRHLAKPLERIRRADEVEEY
jgi:tRNA(Ile2)-agmatinylcytidine synthase